MYRERRKLFPAQPKNREEFHEILEDIGMATNKHENQNNGLSLIHTNETNETQKNNK
jgi:hypothetical protein